MLPNSLVTVLAFWYLLLQSSLPYFVSCLRIDSSGEAPTSTTECLVKCSLKKRPARFKVGKNPVVLQLYNCDVSTSNGDKLSKNDWEKMWLKQVDHALVGGARTVLCIPGDKLRKLLTNVEDNEFFCPNSRLSQNATYSLAGLSGVIFVLILFGFIYRYKEELKLLLFTRLSWHPFDRADDSDPSKIYDAFVSYSSHDIEWVLRTLKEKLESEDPPYRLCIHDRDFLAGAPIYQNIFDSVKTSRRMIMVLSNSFLQSEWCMLEFRVAHRKVLRDRTNYLIIVLFGDVDTKNLNDDELNLYMRTNTYLKVDNRWFWDQLKYSLPQNRLGTSQTRSVGVENVTSI